MCSMKYRPWVMRDNWITDKNTNKIGEKILHNLKPEHVLLRYKRDTVGPPTKTSWWGKAGYKLALNTCKSCSDIQKTEFEIIYERADFSNKKLQPIIDSFSLKTTCRIRFLSLSNFC